MPEEDERSTRTIGKRHLDYSAKDPPRRGFGNSEVQTLDYGELHW